MNPLPPKLENFAQAFSTRSGGCNRFCECGREFWDSSPDGGGWSWQSGEREALAANPNATGVPYTVETLSFEGKDYCIDCECWHPRALQIIGFLDYHAAPIAQYLLLEKKRKQTEADQSPTVA